MASQVDLHTHTTASDGTLEPPELLRLASENAIRFLAITDHNSTAGYEAVLVRHTQYPNLELIPAIEINAEGPLACHVLGYWIDAKAPEFQQELRRYRDVKKSHVQAMTQKLTTLGVMIDFQRILELAKGGALGRPHLADAMIEKGYVKNRQEAFDRFLKKEGPAYIPAETPTALEAIRLIRNAKGVPVLAHPSYYTSEDLLKKLVDMGLMGIEVYYPEHSRSLIQRYLQVAATYHLIATGGSDFHGPKTGREAIGCVDVPISVMETLHEARIKNAR